MSRENLVTKPFFSIVIPTKNKATLLKNLIDSIMFQNFDDYELIVADNSDNLLVQGLLDEHKNEVRLINVKIGDLNMAEI